MKALMARNPGLAFVAVLTLLHVAITPATTVPAAASTAWAVTLTCAVAAATAKALIRVRA